MADKFIVQAITHPGLRRSINQDRVAVNNWTAPESLELPKEFALPSTTPLTCMVADGMGGRYGGEKASAIAIATVQGEASAINSPDDLRSVLDKANQAVFSAMTRETTGMGTTIAGVRLSADTVIYFNVGDSRVYQFSEARLEQLSVDHTFSFSRHGNVRRGAQLTQALGGSLTYHGIAPHIGVKNVNAPAKYLICSDGLTDLVEDSEIAEVLSNENSDDALTLLQMALERGGKDNISMIIVAVS